MFRKRKRRPSGAWKPRGQEIPSLVKNEREKQLASIDENLNRLRESADRELAAVKAGAQSRVEKAATRPCLSTFRRKGSLLISKMHRIEVVGPSAILDRVLSAVQDRGVLHIEEIPLAEYGEKGLLHRVALSDERLKEKHQLEELLEILDEAVTHVPESVLADLERSASYRREYERWEKADVGTIGVASRSMHAKVRSFVRRRHNVADDLRALSTYEEVVAALAPLVESHELSKEYRVCRDHPGPEDR